MIEQSAPVNRSLRDALPLATLFVATLFDLLWVPVPGFNAVAPSFPLMVAFCWTLWRPQAMPAVLVFAIGLFEDLLRGTPFGAGPLALLAIQAYVRLRPGATKSPPSGVPWLSFGIGSLFAATANWLALSFA